MNRHLALSMMLAAALRAATAAEPPAPADVSTAPAVAASAAPAAANAASAPPAMQVPPPAPPAFQGLPWGAEEAQITARFGDRLGLAVCDAAQRAQAARHDEVCGSPTVPRYEVAGVPFVLTLHLDAVQRRLVRVTLVHSAEHGRSDEPRWSDNHRVLRRLLTQRYGGPEFTDLQHEGGVSSAVARWRTGPALIELSSTFQARGTAQPAREHISITYKSPLHGEASKL